MTRWFIGALDKLFHWIGLSVGVAVLLTVGVISYGALARELFGLSDVWVTDVTTYLMGYIAFVGMTSLAWQGRHLKIDILGHFLGLPARRVLARVSGMISAFVSIMLLWLCGNFWLDALESNEHSWGMLSMPLWIPYLSLFAGSFLLALALIVRIAVPLVQPDNTASK